MTSNNSLSKPLDEGSGCAKLVYGQAYFIEDSLVQDQILVLPGGKMASNTVTLIKNIWEDLVSSASKCQGKGKYFYWVYTITDIGNDDITYEVQIEAPRPPHDLFDSLTESEIKNGNDYVKYWSKKIKEAKENYEKSYAIQRKDISLPGTNYISQTGEEIVLDDITIKNNSLGDIENLLSMF